MKDKNKIPDRRATEKIVSDISRLLEKKDFKSEEEAGIYMDGIIKNGKVPDVPPKNACEFAQDIMYEAWESDSPKEQIKLAKEALGLSDECADAYNLLAETEAETLYEAKELYQKGMEAGRRALGDEFFSDKDSPFWGYPPSRAYMRSHFGFMECLWELGEHKEAIRQANELLKLNANDNQGVRYILIIYLLEIGLYDELDQFINYSERKDDCMAEWLYTRALLSFVNNGDSVKANSDLKVALKSNQYIPEYLTGKKNIPNVLPDRITMGGEDEGFYYASRYMKGWQKATGAIDWLKDKAGIKIIPKVGRNDMCSCGSGKKYKKCCGV